MRATYRLAGVHVGDVTLQPLHGPVEEAVDGLVFILLVGGLNDQGYRTIKCPWVHGSYYYQGGLWRIWAQESLRATTQDSPEDKVPSNPLHPGLRNPPESVPAVSGGGMWFPLYNISLICGGSWWISTISMEFFCGDSLGDFWWKQRKSLSLFAGKEVFHTL